MFNRSPAATRAAAVPSGKAAPLPPPRRARNLRARLLAICALLGGVAAVLVPLSAIRDDSPEPSPPARESAATPTATPTETAAAPRELSATATVRAFYRRAAAGDFARAWKLAGPGMRSAFGNSSERFRSELSSLRQIEFERVAVTERDDASATIEIQSVATHDDRVDHCSGTLRTVRDDRGRWVVEPAGLDCAGA